MKICILQRRVVPAAVLALIGLTGCSASGGDGARTVTRDEAITRPVTVSGGDGRTLAVMAESGGCDDLPRLRVVSETSRGVTLTVRVVTRTGRDVVCPAAARFGPACATLRTPLGSRTVTDGRTGRRLVVREEGGAGKAEAPHCPAEK
ncbi:hypothetical protein [Streptomyces naphthomycinicus]|uniref:hypothetical protein n=1 Tax=Streptomyces naphthomycinicus TaxID=2872625 RepID=UPI001CEDA043|nr:hypothetical protein [Streptomyces sp. TML10]